MKSMDDDSYDAGFRDGRKSTLGEITSLEKQRDELLKLLLEWKLMDEAGMDASDEMLSRRDEVIEASKENV